MNINPHFIALRGINLIQSFKTQIDQIINQYETNRTLNCFSGIRPTIAAGQFPSFELETENVDTEWGTARGQRHTCSFRCLVTIMSPKIDYREEYLCSLTSAITSILKNPKYLQFPITCENAIDERGKYVLYVFDSLVSSINYSSVKEGTVGVAEFTWTAKVHERMADILFANVPEQLPSINKPLVIEVRNDSN